MLELRDLLLQENKHFIIIIWTQIVSYSVRCLLERNCHNSSNTDVENMNVLQLIMSLVSVYETGFVLRSLMA